MFWKVCAIGGLLANAALGAAFSVNVGQNADPTCSLAQCAGIGAETIVTAVANAAVGLGRGDAGDGGNDEGESPAFEPGTLVSLSVLADLGAKFSDFLGIGANVDADVNGTADLDAGETSTLKADADLNADVGLDLGLDGDGTGGDDGCLVSTVTGLFGSLFGAGGCE